ncbi:hypothetical protein GCM10025868_31120 [Angustibacter aerolatus]|uniref:NADH-Ubiquinone oxidoreductase (complex I) chain 5 N-terminal domain-containing protein n=1 Tax=Angustibacter aerolatus TaxID=1162965 RepID=A0ABQ6JJB9_9ACTN|nr:hypothetical protein [Angustibacter aerolatus]GMA87862.1 hypothetical protein GCM10025868_31120 [Angustibacter aerolatus]
MLAAEGAFHTTAASGAFSLTWLLVGLPLLGAAVLLLGGRRTDRFGHLVGTLCSWGAFVVAAILFVALLGESESGRSIDQHLFGLGAGRRLPGSTPGCCSTRCRWRSCCW